MQLKVNPRLKPILTDLVNQIKNEPHVIRLILFGSQARMDADKDSDIDLLVIIDENPAKHKKYNKPSDISEDEAYKLQTWGEIKNMLDGKNTDVVVETPNTIKQRGKIQGSVQYYAVREGIVLYERDDSDQLTIGIKDAGYDEQTEHWLVVAKAKLKEVAEFNGNCMLSCFRIYESINASMKAMLAYEHINYEFTRDLNSMNKLLLTPFTHDLVRASTWRRSFKPLKNHKNEVTDQDINDGTIMATEIYDKVKNKCVMSKDVFS